MPTPAVPTLTLGDKLVDLISAGWSPSAPSAVSRVFDVPITPTTLKTMQGRKVFVIPVGYRREPATRGGKNKWIHHFLILTIEKYDEQVSGIPTLAWADDLVKFVLDLAGWLDWPQNGANLVFGSPQRSVWTESFEEIEVYDPDMLSGHSLFWSTIDVYFGEVL